MEKLDTNKFQRKEKTFENYTGFLDKNILIKFGQIILNLKQQIANLQNINHHSIHDTICIFIRSKSKSMKSRSTSSKEVDGVLEQSCMGCSRNNQYILAYYTYYTTKTEHDLQTYQGSLDVGSDETVQKLQKQRQDSSYFVIII